MMEDQCPVFLGVWCREGVGFFVLCLKILFLCSSQVHMQRTEVRGLKHHYVIIPVCKTNVSKLSSIYYRLFADHLKLICSRGRSCSALQRVSTEASSSFKCMPTGRSSSAQLREWGEGKQMVPGPPLSFLYVGERLR